MVALSSSEIYDVAIVGASYSGLMAGITAAKSGKVLLIEKRRKPGSPVNSTGAVPIEWLKNMEVYPSDECIAGPIRGVELIGPSDASVTISNKDPDGMVLYPDRYVNWLAERAKDKGCTIKTETVFRGISYENGRASKAEAGRPTTISTTKGDFRARYVIGADGAWTAVGQATGLGELPKDEDLHIGLEYHVENHNIQDPEIYRLYVGHELAPLGYAWSFPEGKTHLKVGVGIPKSEGIAPTKLMDKFFAKYPGYKTKYYSANGGNIPTAPPLKTASGTRRTSAAPSTVAAYGSG
jgi:flavin-dependent dehydrogenase